MRVALEECPADKTHPDAGVVRDARARGSRRRKRVLAAAVLTAAIVGGLLGALGGGSKHGSAARGASQRRLAFERARELRRAVAPHISPALEGGSYGWAVIERSGGGCCTLPTPNPRGVAIGTSAGWSGDRREETITALVARGVTGFVARGERGRMVTLARLPYGLRLVHIEFPRHVQPIGAEGAADLVAIGARERPIGLLRDSGPGATAVRWWAKPQAQPAGPCQIRAHGLAGLEREWGHVAVAIRAYPAHIIGRAFFSCIDTEYFLHNWPLETAILLDAQQPGSAPAPIPGMHAIAGVAGVFAAPGDWHGQITAVRDGNFWLAVAGGSGLMQRLQVLRHLSGSVSLSGFKLA
jgi:hypothetical protein